MTLAQYRSKRNFQNTPEPKGGKGNNNKLHFVVQKHAASHLHYDFRLELSGVLKSWAIPNGPSLDPREKRLAIMVEDHPLDYRTFEGVIPEGNYGAGTVMVWDKGTYQNYKKSSAAAASKNLKEGLSSGDLKFILDGKKLKGAFVLVKMKGSNDDKNWLLIKKKDSFATTADPLEKDHSVLSGLPFTEIQTQKAPRINKKILDLRGAKRVKQPKSFSPMLATLVYEPFDDPDWISEVKWDGYRIIAFVEDGEVQLRSRNEKDYTSIFKPVADELRTLDFNCVLDGEIAVADREGRSDFSALQNYQKTGRGNLCYFVFDLPFANGYDLRDLTLLRRKNALQSIVNGMEYIKYSDHISGKMPEMFREAVKNNLEGIMAKDASSKYVSGKRSRSWLKIKVHKRQEAVIGGFTAPKGSRIKLGSLILGIYENQKLVYVGHTGGGLSNRTLEDLYNRLHPLERKTSPFSSNFRVNAPVTWVDPKLVCEVTFAEWTPEGRMRQPIFVGLREDKNPKLATREEPKEISELAEKGAAKTRRTRNKLTHLDKIYWPDEGYTKGDLLDYYDKVAPRILPYLRNRPESLNRHPNGIGKEGFFQKDVENPPEWVKTAALHSDSGDKEINWLICNNRDTLRYLANLGCIEINPWHSRLASLDKPDYCLIDIDAKTCPFDKVINVALVTKTVLDELGVPGYPKTSGKSGMHICIPLAGRYSYEQSRQFAELIVDMVQARLPELTSVQRNPSKRKGKIYLDFLQNSRGQTMAAPYSVRPVPGAPVSTPLAWEEVTQDLRPMSFTIKTSPHRFETLGDLWTPVVGKGIDMKQVLEDISSSPDPAVR